VSPRRTFGATWWGEAWIRALEDRAQLDPNRLPRGRTYARHDHVLALVVDQGEVRAPVSGSRATPYRVTVRIRTYSDEEWDRLLDAVAARSGHSAALLDGELDPGVDEDARSAGVELLPTAGEVQTRCSCPDWAEPCKHAAAVCYLVADRLDEDPFELFALRGRSRDEILADLRRRRQSSSRGADGGGGGEGDSADPALDRGAVERPGPAPDPGVPAAEAWRRDPAGATAPPPTLRMTPGHPAPWPVDPPEGASFTADGLRHLATDAARRAWAMMAGTGDGGLQLRHDHDLVRRAADALGTDDWSGLLERTGERADSLARRARAWRHGGVGGLDALQQSTWRPPPTTMAAGRDALAAATGRRARVSGNRVNESGGRVQLRHGPDGLWYRFEKRGGRWEPVASPSPDPDDVAAELG
jgi:uncharacterized Zn finger protein